MTLKTVLPLLLVLLAGPAVAGPGPGPYMDIDKLAILLDLDEYQKQQVGEIVAARKEERDALRAEIEAGGERPDLATVREWHESSQAELRESLAAVLSAEQLEKFEILAERPMQRMLRHRDRPDRAGADDGAAVE
ncbi:MAG TPA: hypothetical protein VFY03_07705 [Woeseiaceae bacterium]|nr:hypothetical protein [Woeseiaceae bacterium]